MNGVLGHFYALSRLNWADSAYLEPKVYANTASNDHGLMANMRCVSYSTTKLFVV